MSFDTISLQSYLKDGTDTVQQLLLEMGYFQKFFLICRNGKSTEINFNAKILILDILTQRHICTQVA